MAIHLIFTTFLLIFSCACAGRNDIYRGFTVHGVKLKEKSDLKVVGEAVARLGLDAWARGALGRRDALLMVTRHNEPELLRALDDNGIEHYVYLADVVKALDDADEEISKWRRTRTRKAVPFEDYPRYAEIVEYMECLAARYPALVTVVNAGPSFEGRDVKYLKISTTNFTDTNKPIYFMDGVMHAREWVTAPVALYTMHRLVEDLRSEDRDLLETVDWIILPVVNPDGYEFTHTDQRLWRQTRSFRPAVSARCRGADINRNFNISFNTIGVSSDPCSQIYPGPEPYSEIETVYVRDIVREHADRIQLYLNMHSFGNLILFGYDDLTLPPNAVELHFVGSVMGAAIDVHKLPAAPHYLVGNGALLLYAVSGSAQDYVQALGVPFSYTLELPQFGGYSFEVPPQYIEQINRETWSGVAASARACALFYAQRRGV